MLLVGCTFRVSDMVSQKFQRPGTSLLGMSIQGKWLVLMADVIYALKNQYGRH
jgi:hypothetical protein